MYVGVCQKLAYMTIRFLQVNTDRRSATYDRPYDMLHQHMREEGVNIVMGQEPNSFASRTELCDKNKDAFIKLSLENSELMAKNHIVGEGYVCVEFDNFMVISAYFSPNKPSELLENLLVDIENLIKCKRKETIIGGDMNAKSSIFGSLIAINEKGRILEEWVSCNDLVVLNRGNTPTFKNSNGESLIDVTLATAGISRHITG